MVAGVLADTETTPQAKTTEFDVIYRLESAAFTVLFVSGRSRSSVSSLVMIGCPRRGLCGVGIVPLSLPYRRQGIAPPHVSHLDSRPSPVVRVLVTAFALSQE